MNVNFFVQSGAFLRFFSFNLITRTVGSRGRCVSPATYLEVPQRVCKVQAACLEGPCSIFPRCSQRVFMCAQSVFSGVCPTFLRESSQRVLGLSATKLWNWSSGRDLSDYRCGCNYDSLFNRRFGSLEENLVRAGDNKVDSKIKLARKSGGKLMSIPIPSSTANNSSSGQDLLWIQDLLRRPSPEPCCLFLRVPDTFFRNPKCLLL